MKLLKTIMKLLRPIKRCSMCNRPLSNAVDRARGIGAACAKKLQAKTLEENK
jgi:hypothetical protein